MRCRISRCLPLTVNLWLVEIEQLRWHFASKRCCQLSRRIWVCLWSVSAGNFNFVSVQVPGNKDHVCKFLRISLFHNFIMHCVSEENTSPFNRAMLRKARLCRSKSSSVCLSVCDVEVCFFHTCRNTSKIISRPNSLRYLLTHWPQHRRSGPTGTPTKIRWNRGWVRSTKNLQYLRNGAR